MNLSIRHGRVKQAIWVESPNCDDCDDGFKPEALIIHCISLPPGEYGGGHIAQFFQNTLPVEKHAYFSEISHLTVSSHFLIERDGRLVQFVSTDKRAWHAGESFCLQKPKANNFAIGIELEGLDSDPKGFTCLQYQRLAELTQCLIQHYSLITSKNIFAHSDIAPGRKLDPGPFFDWVRYLKMLAN